NVPSYPLPVFPGLSIPIPSPAKGVLGATVAAINQYVAGQAGTSYQPGNTLTGTGGGSTAGGSRCSTPQRMAPVYYVVITATDPLAGNLKDVEPNTGYNPGFQTQQEAAQTGQELVREYRAAGWKNAQYRIVSASWPVDANGNFQYFTGYR